jgi:hypothetical protein
MADVRLEALRALRPALAERDPEAFAGLKESHLRNIATHDAISAEEVAPYLSAAASVFAADIAEALGSIAVDATPVTDSETARGSAAEPGAPGPVRAHGPDPAADSPAQDVAPDGFAPFDFSIPAGEAIAMTGAVGADSQLALSWPAYSTSDPIVIYRVVASDQQLPYSPDLATLVAATTGLSATDPSPFSSAVRYLQVWVNAGRNLEKAKAAQPLLLAQQSFVAPPQGVDIREDEGRITGSWDTFPGIERVHVYRIPIERAAQEPGAPQHRILSDEENLGGFVDREVQRGSGYLYQVYAEAPVAGVSKLSQPVSTTVSVSDFVEPVLDLSVESHEEDDGAPQFDLTWTTQRGGKVAIFRTEQSPNAGAGLKAIAESALGGAGLNPDDRLPYRIVNTGGKSHMDNVPWPRNWPRAYFTPVTILGHMAYVGPTVSHVYVHSIAKVKLVERVNKQILTFSWPEGVTSVLVYEGAPPPPVDPAIAASPGLEPSNQQYVNSVIAASPALEVTKQAYVDRGGFTFARPLASDRGCIVILVPVAFQAGARVTGRPTVVDYPRLLRVRYETKVSRTLVGSATGVSVTVSADVSLPPKESPDFVLVHNPERFPLSREDGRVLMMVPEAVEGAKPGRLIKVNGLSPQPSEAWRTHADSWKAEVSKSAGYVRLFANLPPEALTMVAVLDPAPAGLRLHKRQGS